MSAPNIVGVSTITGKTLGAQLNTANTDILINSASSGKVYKVNTILVSNIDGTNSTDITVGFYDSSASYNYRLAYTTTVPAKATIDLLGKSIYLEEGDKIIASSSANLRSEMVISYEEIS